MRKLIRYVLALFCVFAFFGCQNDFASKAVNLIDPIAKVPPLIVWETDTVLVNTTNASAGSISPNKLNGVISNSGRKILFVAGNPDLIVGPQTELEDGTMSPSPDVLTATTTTSNTVTVTLKAAGIADVTPLLESFTLSFPPTLLKGSDKGTVGTPEFSFSVKAAKDIEFLQSLLDFESTSTSPAPASANATTGNSVIEVLAASINGYTFFSGAIRNAYLVNPPSDAAALIALPITWEPIGDLDVKEGESTGDYAVSLPLTGLDGTAGTIKITVKLTKTDDAPDEPEPVAAP